MTNSMVVKSSLWRMTFQSFGFWVLDFFSVTTAVSPCSRGFPLGIAPYSTAVIEVRHDDTRHGVDRRFAHPRTVRRCLAAWRGGEQPAARGPGRRPDPPARRERRGRG